LFQSRQPDRKPLAYDADCHKNTDQFLVPFAVAVLRESGALLSLHCFTSVFFDVGASPLTFYRTVRGENP
jgi:hypothetical protein